MSTLTKILAVTATVAEGVLTIIKIAKDND